MKPRKPLNVGDMVAVYDGRLSSTVWYGVMSVPEDGLVTVDANFLGVVIHRNQVYRVSAK